MSNLQERLKTLRNNNKLTQRQLAKKLNISPSTVALYETGDRNPDMTMLKRIADFFNVSVDYLLGQTNIPEQYKEKTTNLPENITPDMVELLEKISSLSEESKKDLEEYIKLLKLRDDTESTRDESSLTLEEHA